MPRFYFHVRSGEVLNEDPEGADLPSIDVAHEEAVKDAREIVAAKVARGEVIGGQTFVISTKDGRVLREVPFKSVLRME